MLARRLVLVSLCACAALTLTGRSRADNWPQWRGVRGDGVCDERNVPIRWSKTENVLWRLPLPGPAGATPVVWGERIFLTSVAGPEKSDLVLLCVGAGGQPLWQETIARGSKDVRNDEGNYASPSPSTDGKHVWAFFGTGDLACFTVEGKPVWHCNVQERFGKFNIQFGMASTPVLDRGRLYLQLIHGDGNPATREARVVCLDAASGDTIWQTERPSDGRQECEHSYASPVLYRDAARSFLVTHGADYVVAHDLADGRELWRCGDLNPKGQYNNTLRFVASPVAVPGLIVVPSAKKLGMLGLMPDGSGDLTDNLAATYWRWTNNTTDVPSPLVAGDLLYVCKEGGELLVAEAKSGEIVYLEPTTRDRHRASPVFADGHVYLTARNGTITVVKAGRKFEVVAKNELGESTSASPIFANGRLYVRTFDALYAIGK